MSQELPTPQLLHKPCAYLKGLGNSTFELFLTVKLLANEKLVNEGMQMNEQEADKCVFHIAEATIEKEDIWTHEEIVPLTKAGEDIATDTIIVEVHTPDKAKKKHRVIVHYADADFDVVQDQV